MWITLPLTMSPSLTTCLCDSSSKSAAKLSGSCVVGVLSLLIVLIETMRCPVLGPGRSEGRLGCPGLGGRSWRTRTFRGWGFEFLGSLSAHADHSGGEGCEN